ncbi:MAG: helix-turn-helix domain-containing protein [Lutibacter sp.]
MKFDTKKFKNINKSTSCISSEKDKFKVLYFNNNTENQYYNLHLSENYIHLLFNIKKPNKIAVNLEHCAVNLPEKSATIAYFNESNMNLLLSLSKQSELFILLISLEYFHSLFTQNGDFFINFSNLSSNKPIIEHSDISTSIAIILQQIVSKNMDSKLKPIYIKGKIYELLSIFFENDTLNESESCPYIANEDTLLKLKKVKEIVLNNMNNPPSLIELSKMVGLNIKKLKSDFKEIYGAPVFTFLINHKLELAKKMILENKYNINEISSKLGYSSSSHFIAAFKKKFGITPKKYSKV